MSSQTYTLPKDHPHSLFHKITAYFLFLVAMYFAIMPPTGFSLSVVGVVITYLAGLSAVRYTPPGASQINAYLAGMFLLMFGFIIGVGEIEFIYVYGYQLNLEYFIFMLLPTTLTSIILMRYIFYKECNLC